jgi:hypothetical protein
MAGVSLQQTASTFLYTLSHLVFINYSIIRLYTSNDIYFEIFFVKKGPAGGATDAPQP